MSMPRKYLVGDATFYHVFQKGCPGTEVVFATHPQCSVPVATLWFHRNMMDRTEILSCYTVDFFRRMGFLRALIAKLNQWWPNRIICTALASKLAEPALKKIGFKQTASGWHLPVPSVPSCKNPRSKKRST